jgi:hypothetical protein
LSQVPLRVSHPSLEFRDLPLAGRARNPRQGARKKTRGANGFDRGEQRSLHVRRRAKRGPNGQDIGERSLYEPGQALDLPRAEHEDLTLEQRLDARELLQHDSTQPDPVAFRRVCRNHRAAHAQNLRIIRTSGPEGGVEHVFEQLPSLRGEERRVVRDLRELPFDVHVGAAREPTGRNRDRFLFDLARAEFVSIAAQRCREFEQPACARGSVPIRAKLFEEDACRNCVPKEPRTFERLDRFVQTAIDEPRPPECLLDACAEDRVTGRLGGVFTRG